MLGPRQSFCVLRIHCGKAMLIGKPKFLLSLMQ